MTMALILGLALTGIEMAWSVSRERDKAGRLANEILDLLDGAASTAVWTFDQDLATRVARDALTLNAVRGLTLKFPNGEVLAASSREGTSDSLLASMVFGDLTLVDRQLYRPRNLRPMASSDPMEELTGVMRIQLDGAVISADLLAFLGNSLFSGLVRNLLLGLGLTLVFNRFLTRPLVQLGRDIDLIDPSRPEDSAVAVPAEHVGNELGGIAMRVNDLLQRLAAVQADLRRLSTRDPLTRLHNRALFDEGLATALVRARRNGQSLAVMVVQMRPEALARGGDEAIRHVSVRLRDCVRGADLVARLGSGEFAAVLAEADAPRAMRVADRVISGLAHGLAVGDVRIDNTPSIGIALYPSEAAEGEALTAAARAAAARATATNSQVQFVTEGLTDIAHDYLDRADALLSALEQDEMILKYQPLLEVGTGRACGVVTIPVWQHAGRITEGFDLVRFAREIGLDVSLSDKVLRQGLRAAAGHDIPWPLTVRCVDRQLADPGFLDLLLRLRQDHAIPAGGLALLISQSAFEQVDILPILGDLHAAGVALWLDVRAAKSLPVGVLTSGLLTGLEIVAPAGEVPPAMAAVLRLAAEAGMVLAARKVESSAQWVVRAGCKRLRGPAIAPGVPLDRLAEVVTAIPTRAEAGALHVVDKGPVP